MINANWEKELGIPIRWSRPPVEAMEEIVKIPGEPQIVLKREKDGDAIVIKFPMIRSMEEPLRSLAESLPIAFEEVLWRKAEKHNNNTWSEFEKIGRAAYREAWLMLFQRMYLNRRDPNVEQWLTKLKSDLEASSKSGVRPGRRRLPKAEKEWLARQFGEISPQCQAVHRAAQDAIRSSNTPTEIRKAVWETVKESIPNMPEYGAIFSGEAFDSIIYKGRGRPQLHDPKSWNPRQLAIALLSIRLSSQYQTVEKRLARIRQVGRK